MSGVPVATSMQEWGWFGFGLVVADENGQQTALPAIRLGFVRLTFVRGSIWARILDLVAG